MVENQGWITCHFTFFQTVFRSYMYPPLQGGIKPGVDNLPFHVLSNSIRSYQDDEGMMMKGCVKWNTVYDLDDLSLGSPRSAGQRLTH